LGLPKEIPEFWERLQRLEPFNQRHTLLIDDSVSVLRSAANYGISHLLSIRQPDSQLPAKDITEFKAINHFQELIPNIK
jgi:putative hydrolase of the HAD superfamily